MEEAAKEGKGAVSLDGRLIDAASIRMAENLMRKVEQMRTRPERVRDGAAGQMNIHEYQAKALLRSYRVTTPRGEVVYTSKAAARVAEELGGQRWVVKAQIHAGGRGKAGGVKLGNSPAQDRRDRRPDARAPRSSPRRPAPRASASAACWSSAPRGSSGSSTCRWWSTATRSGSS